MNGYIEEPIKKGLINEFPCLAGVKDSNEVEILCMKAVKIQNSSNYRPAGLGRVLYDGKGFIKEPIRKKGSIKDLFSGLAGVKGSNAVGVYL